MSVLPKRAAVVVFPVFAFAYFLCALMRAITATLAPILMQEFALNARDFGLLAGSYFLGFAAMQLPLGLWLNRHGPQKVSLYFLLEAVDVDDRFDGHGGVHLACAVAGAAG